MKQAIIILFLLIAAFTLQAQQIIWENGYNHSTSHDDVFLAMSLINGTSVVVSGNVHPTYQSFYMAYQANGTRSWQRAGRTLWTGNQDIQPFNNSYFYTASLPNNTISPAGSYIMLQRLGPTGDTLWTRKYTGSNYHAVDRMMIVGNNIYLGGGDGSPNSIGGYIIIKTDTSGVLQWRRTYKAIWGTTGSCDLVQRPNGNIIISGRSQTSNAMAKLYLVEVNASNGDSLRSAVITIKGAGYKEEHRWILNNFSLTTDGNYICSGTIDSANYKLGYVAKIDTALNLIWSRIIRPTFNSQQVATNKVKELANGNFALLAKDNIWSGGHLFHIYKLNPLGHIISQTTYYSQLCNNVYFNDWELLDDGTGIVAGRCSSNNEAYIARIGGVGVPAVVGIPEATATKDLLGQSYPNPTAATAAIPYRLPKGTVKASIVLYDVVTGRKVKSLDLPASETEGSLQVELSGLSNGLYAYSLIVDGKPVATKKLAVMK